MKIESIVGYLQKQMGMNPDAVGFYTMKKAVYTAMLSCDLDDLDEYYQLIQSNGEACYKGLLMPSSFQKPLFFVIKNHLRCSKITYASSIECSVEIGRAHV